MKKQFFVILTIALACGIFVASCGQSSESTGSEPAPSKIIKKETPSDAVRKSATCLQKGDFKGALQYRVDYEEMTEKQLDEFVKLTESLYNMRKGLESYEIVDEKIAEDGKSAVVTTEFVFGDGSTNKSSDKLLLTDKGWRMK